MHRLLRRQLRLSRSDEAGEALDLDRLLALVDSAYGESDRERRFMAHAYQVIQDDHAALLQRQSKTHEMVAQIRAEKAEAERARAVAEAELLKKERLSVLGQLTATVAHELRNPLSSIGNSFHAIREIASARDMPIERAMARVERSIARCNGIISDLLDYARAPELKRVKVALDPFLAEIVDEQKFPADILIERRLAAPAIKVSLDLDRFRRVIINLLENAVQAFLECAAPVRRISIATLAAETADIVITDSGPGIPAEIMPRIFEPLFSTKSFGTGLGLPTVKQIVEQHDGTISITSAPGAGTSVRIRLKAA
jgi:signal transduction histidine kinase